MGLGANAVWGFLGKVKSIFDGRGKEVAETVASQYKSATSQAVEGVGDFLRKEGSLSEDAIKHVENLTGRPAATAESAAKAALSRGGWKTWAMTGTVVTGLGLVAQPVGSALMTAWNTVNIESGNTGFFHQIWDWIAKFMDNLEISDDFPRFRNWLEGKRENNQGVMVKAWNSPYAANPVSAVFGIDNPLPGKMDTVAEYSLLAGGAYGAKKAYGAYRGRKGGGGDTPPNPDGSGKGTGFEAKNSAPPPSEFDAAKKNGNLDLFDRTPSNAVKATADVVETAAEKSLVGRLSGSFMKHAKTNILFTAVAGAGLFVADKAFGATNEEALDTSTSVLPFKDAFVQAEAGNTEAAVRSAVVDGVGIGVGIGATAGAMFFGVGAVPGAIIGGVVGVGASMAADYLWAAPAPEPTPVAVLENMNAEFETAAMDTTPATPDFSSAWNNQTAGGGQRRHNRGLSLTPATA